MDIVAGVTIAAILGLAEARYYAVTLIRHCEPTGRANARPMTGSAKQSIKRRIARAAAADHDPADGHAAPDQSRNHRRSALAITVR